MMMLVVVILMKMIMMIMMMMTMMIIVMMVMTTRGGPAAWPIATKKENQFSLAAQIEQVGHISLLSSHHNHHRGHCDDRHGHHHHQCVDHHRDHCYCDHANGQSAPLTERRARPVARSQQELREEMLLARADR